MSTRSPNSAPWPQRHRAALGRPGRPQRADPAPHDRYGYRVDEIEYDPAYHELMRAAIGHGLHAAPWADDRPGAHVVRARPR